MAHPVSDQTGNASTQYLRIQMVEDILILTLLPMMLAAGIVTTVIGLPSGLKWLSMRKLGKLEE